MAVARAILAPIADLINASELAAAADSVNALLRQRRVKLGKHWRRDLKKLALILAGGAPAFRIIARGNSKLGDKFLAFSTLPATKAGGIGCPGSGDCVNWCYSLKAWRYPAAFCRQAQNTVLLQSTAGRALIAAALDREHAAGFTIFRLYVDGDFSARAPIAGQTDLDFWMATLTARPTIIAYGYSKSHMSFTKRIVVDIPTNYRVNVSGGSNATAADLDRMRALPATRGDFVAVSGIRPPAGGHSAPGHRRALVRHYRDMTGRKAFACPGACHACTPKHGHACASSKFQNIDIIIAAH
jgi:hypothetical protein